MATLDSPIEDRRDPSVCHTPVLTKNMLESLKRKTLDSHIKSLKFRRNSDGTTRMPLAGRRHSATYPFCSTGTSSCLSSTFSGASSGSRSGSGNKSCISLGSNLSTRLVVSLHNGLFFSS